MFCFVKDGDRRQFEPHVGMLGNEFPFTRLCINEHVYRLRAPPPLIQEYSILLVIKRRCLRKCGAAAKGLRSQGRIRLRSRPCLSSSGLARYLWFRKRRNAHRQVREPRTRETASVLPAI